MYYNNCLIIHAYISTLKIHTLDKLLLAVDNTPDMPLKRNCDKQC